MRVSFALRRNAAAAVGFVALLCVTYRAFFDGEVLAGRDVFRLFIPDNALLSDYLAHFDWPLWNPYSRMGQPFAATMQSQVFYPPRVLTVCLFGPVVAITAMQVLHVTIAALGIVWFLRPLLRRWYAPWAAGVMFALSPMFTDLGIQQNVVDAAAWSGFLLGALHRRHWRLFAVVLSMTLLAASPETTLWQLLLCLLLALQQRVTPSRLVLSSTGGAGIAAVMLLPALELTRLSIRGAWDVSSGHWSMSWRQVIASFWPAFDRPLPDDYWGDDQHFISNVFLGGLVLALAILGALRGPKLTRLFAGAGVALLLFSMGRHLPVVRTLLEVPPFTFFRYPAKAYVGVAFCAAVLAGFGLDAAVRLARKTHARRRWALAVLGGGAVLWLGFSRLLPLLPLRSGALLGAPWPWFVFGSVAFAFFMLPAGRARGPVFGATLAALCILELVLARWVFVIPENSTVSVLSAPSIVPSLLPSSHGRISAAVYAAPETFVAEQGNSLTLSRVLLVPNRFMEERLETVSGYGAPEPERFERLDRTGARGFYDLAGTTHFLSEEGIPFPDVRLLATLPGKIGLYESTTALPRAFVVQRSVIATDEEALRAIENDDTQPFRKTVFLAEGAVRTGAPCESRVTRESAGLREAAYSVEACDDGFLVMSDSFFPGWHARVDGVDSPVLRADYAFRAVAVTKGAHRVELHYWPASFTIGLAISLLSLLGLLKRYSADTPRRVR